MYFFTCTICGTVGYFPLGFFFSLYSDSNETRWSKMSIDIFKSRSYFGSYLPVFHFLHTRVAWDWLHGIDWVMSLRNRLFNPLFVCLAYLYLSFLLILLFRSSLLISSLLVLFWQLLGPYHVPRQGWFNDNSTMTAWILHTIQERSARYPCRYPAVTFLPPGSQAVHSHGCA